MNRLNTGDDRLVPSIAWSLQWRIRRQLDFFHDDLMRGKYPVEAVVPVLTSLFNCRRLLTPFQMGTYGS